MAHVTFLPLLLPAQDFSNAAGFRSPFSLESDQCHSEDYVGKPGKATVATSTVLSSCRSDSHECRNGIQSQQCINKSSCKNSWNQTFSGGLQAPLLHTYSCPFIYYSYTYIHQSHYDTYLSTHLFLSCCFFVANMIFIHSFFFLLWFIFIHPLPSFLLLFVLLSFLSDLIHTCPLTFFFCFCFCPPPPPPPSYDSIYPLTCLFVWAFVLLTHSLPWHHIHYNAARRQQNEEEDLTCRAEPMGKSSMTSLMLCSRAWKASGRGATALPATQMSDSGCSHSGTSWTTVNTQLCYTVLPPTVVIAMAILHQYCKTGTKTSTPIHQVEL